MMAGNPSRWSMHPPSQFQPSSNFLSSSSSALFPAHQFVIGSSSSSLPFNSLPDNYQDLPHHQSWNQLLLYGLSEGEEEERYGPSHFQHKKLEIWEDQILNPPYSRVPVVGDIKQEVQQDSNLYGHGDDEFQRQARPTWSNHNHHHQAMPVSSPRSCVTSLSSNILDFAYNNNTKPDVRNQHLDQSSECNSTATGGVCKKARVQASSSQPPLKVRKEKLGDRITALHQLVSPFGKTDTASVLLEAIGYIRFLQGQIEALSSPYFTSASSNMRNQHSVQGERNSVFPEDPGQLLNDFCLKRKGGPHLQESQGKPKVLRSRGLCLVPLSFTQHVGNDNGADYWAPAIGGEF